MAMILVVAPKIPILVNLVKVDGPSIIPRFLCMDFRLWAIEVWLYETIVSPPGIGCNTFNRGWSLSL